MDVSNPNSVHVKRENTGIKITLELTTDGRLQHLTELDPSVTLPTPSTLCVEDSCPTCSTSLNINIVFHDSSVPTSFSEFINCDVPGSKVEVELKSEDVEPVINLATGPNETLVFQPLPFPQTPKPPPPQPILSTNEPKIIFCGMCYEVLPNHPKLREHQDRHTLDCKFCDYVAHKKPALRVHVRLKHWEYRPQKGDLVYCRRCKYGVVRHRMGCHAKACLGYVTNKNELKSTTRKKLITTKRREAEGTDEMEWFDPEDVMPTTVYNCTECHKDYYSHSSYRRHWAAAHRDLNDPTEGKKRRDDDESINPIPEKRKRLVSSNSESDESDNDFDGDNEHDQCSPFQIDIESHEKPPDGEEVPNIYYCYVCFEVVESFDALKTHRVNHSLVCRFCSRSYGNLDMLRSHTRNVHPNAHPARYGQEPCELCNKPILKSSLTRHREQCALKVEKHEQKLKERWKQQRSKFMELMPEDANLPTKETTIFCCLCLKVFKTIKERRAHMKNNHSLECQFCPPGKVFPSKQNLRHHVVRQHWELRPNLDELIQCKKCNKMMVRSRAETHMKTCVTKPEGEPVCPICNKKFQQWRSVGNHIEIVHEKKNALACHICGKLFSFKTQLEVHLLIHETNDSRPFKCDLCTKAFGTKSSIVDHIERYHLKKPPTFQCDQCEKAYYTVNRLRCHVLSHTKPFECPECKKCFGSKKALGVHTMIHTDERPFPCTECLKRFRSKLDLNSHIRTIHTGEKPYICEICLKGYSDRGCYRAHLITHERQLGITLDKSVKKFKNPAVAQALTQGSGSTSGN